MTTSPPAESGLVICDKPAGWTSHQVVGRLRRLLGTRKVGHAGTLDPMATGVLVVGVNRATRLLGLLALDDKTYAATVRLGLSTVTDDAEGEVTATPGATGLGSAAIDAAVNDLTMIAGQKPVVTRAKKSVAAFKLREGMPIGAMVTLRGQRMYEFVDRLTSVAMPRIRDFRGVSQRGFDGRGN